MKFLLELGIAQENSGVADGSGWWSQHQADGTIDSVNPANEEIIAKIYRCNISDCQKVMTHSHDTFQQWKQIPAPQRGELIRQIGVELRQHKQALGNLISLECGKTKTEADGEVQEMIDMADFAVGQARMLYGNTMQSERPFHRMYEQWLPLGVVTVITAFNFPVAVWAWNAFIAAIAGNTVIWKPSPKTSLCAIAVQKICEKVMAANAYPGIFSLLATDDHQILNSLVDDPRIPLISFTGSTSVGRQINGRVANRLGRCLLELSGNNAVILDETANLDLAIPALMFGAIGTAGQRCTTTRRVIIHESLYSTVISRLIEAYRQIQIGDPLDQRHLMGPLIDRAAVDQYHLALEKIKKAGGKILYGGQSLKRSGFFVLPVLAQAENHWDIVQQETFAPILYLITYRTFEQAIAFQNQVPQGLSSALFSNNLRHAEYFLSTLGSDCGIANINIGTSGAEIGGAFGGEKDTGGGREAGSDAWKNYMRRQTTTINWGENLPLAQGIKFWYNTSHSNS